MNTPRSIRGAFVKLTAGFLVFAAVVSQAAAELDYGDQRSATLTTKAWNALTSTNFDDALAYTGKCIEKYAGEAKKMQNSLKELPANEPKDETSKRWALNDVGTCLFIKGQVLLKKDAKSWAKETFSNLATNFTFAECWDPQGFFWQPADAAKKILAELDGNPNGVAVSPGAAGLDYGDQRSATLTTKAWNALESQNFDDALASTGKCIEKYAGQAKEMQDSLQELPANEPKEETSKRWALNDVGTCYFIKGEALLKKGDKKGAIEAYRTLAKELKFARCWDPKGWFWGPADAAKKKIVELEFDSQ